MLMRQAEAKENAAPESGKVQYSIETLDDGRKYVKADRQVLTGTDPEVWAEQLTRYINRNIRAGNDVALNAEDGTVLLLTATTAEKGSFRNVVYDKNGKPRVLTDDEYQAKLNAEAHIDELVTVSKDVNPNMPNKTDENGVHGDFAKDGWRYRKAYFTDFDGKYYRLILSVAKGTKGSVVYNVAEIRERTFPTLRGSSNQKAGAQGGKDSFSGKKVSQNNKNVNGQNSEWDGGVSDRQLLREAAEREGASEAVKNREATRESDGSENAAENGGKVQYSIKNTRRMTWEKQTDSYLTGKLKSSDSLYLGNSGEYISGVSSSPLYIPTSIVTKAMRPQKGSRSAHAMTGNDIRGLENGIREASAVIYNPDRNALIYFAKEAEKGGQIVATFDLNNDLFGENAHKGTSIHPRESVIPMLEKLGEDAVIYVKNENKFNELAGLQSDNPPELLAKVELVNETIAQEVDPVKTQHSEWDGGVSDRELLREAAEREGASEAVKNREAMRQAEAKENAAPESGKVQYSIFCPIALRYNRVWIAWEQTYHDGEVTIQSIPCKQYMQTEREDVSCTSKAPATKTASSSTSRIVVCIASSNRKGAISFSEFYTKT